jgi:hypothetical protein
LPGPDRPAGAAVEDEAVALVALHGDLHPALAGDDVLAADVLLEVLLDLAAHPVLVMLSVAFSAPVGQPGVAGHGHQR